MKHLSPVWENSGLTGSLPRTPFLFIIGLRRGTLTPQDLRARARDSHNATNEGRIGSLLIVVMKMVDWKYCRFDNSYE